MPPKRSSSSLGVFLGVVILVTYHKVNEYAASFGELGRIDPLLALWVPFALFAAFVIWMFHTIAYVPGGQPLGGLDRVFAQIGRSLARFLPGRARADAAA